jgi:hypothetical protein
MNIFTRRNGYIASIGTVALIAAWGSYRHMADVATIAGQPAEVATTLPLSVDGMLLVATLAMADDKVNGRKPRGWARFAFWLGATISVAANIASTVVHNGPNPLSIGVAAWAPIALLVVTEIMARPGKTDTAAEDEARQPAASRRIKTDEERLEEARKRAGYYQMTPVQRAEWTRKRNERIAKRNGAANPVSGQPATADVLTVSELSSIYSA